MVISKARSASASSSAGGGKGPGVTDAPAYRVAGAGEGDPPGIQPGVACGVADQGADRLVAAEHGGDLLADHRRGPLPPHHPRGTPHGARHPATTRLPLAPRAVS